MAPWFVALALLSLTAVLGWRPVTDLDFPLHVASGRWIVMHGTVPDLDPFTYTVSDRPYVAYHWLFQLGVYGIHEAWGGVGLTLARWLLVVATALLVLDALRIRGTTPLAGAIVGLAAVLAVEIRLELRPELISILLGAATIWVIERHRASGQGPLWLLPLIQLLWANSHIFAIGWIILFACTAADVVQRRPGSAALARWTAAAFVAPILNPYHFRAVLYPLYLASRLSGDNVFAQHIVELASPLALAWNGALPFATGPQFAAYAVLIVLGLVAAVYHLRRRAWSDAALIALFACLSLTAVRNIGIFAVVCAVPIAFGVDGVAALVSGRWSPAARRAASAALISLLVAFALVTAVRVVRGAYYLTGVRFERFASGICTDCLSLSAVDWVARSKLAGRGFNNLNVGSALIWRDPARKVFIDARNEVSGEDFFRDYLEMFDAEGWARAVQRFGFEYAVLRYSDDADALGLARHLDRSGDWRLVYVDGGAAVFARTLGPNGSLPPASLPPRASDAQRDQWLESVHPGAGPWARFARWLWSDADTPGASFELGTFLVRLGRLGPAEAPLLEAARSSPDSLEVHYNLGALYWLQRLRRPALQAYRNALALDPSLQGVAMRVRRLEEGAGVDFTTRGSPAPRAAGRSALAPAPRQSSRGMP